MRKTEKKKNKVVQIYLTEDEYNKIKEISQKAGDIPISVYLRRIIKEQLGI